MVGLDLGFFVCAVIFSNVHHLLMSECNFICSFTILPSVTWYHDLLEFFTDSLDLTALKGVVSSALFIISVLYCTAKYLLLLSHLWMCWTAKYLLLAALFHCQNHHIISTLFPHLFCLLIYEKIFLKETVFSREVPC